MFVTVNQLKKKRLAKAAGSTDNAVNVLFAENQIKNMVQWVQLGLMALLCVSLYYVREELGLEQPAAMYGYRP